MKNVMNRVWVPENKKHPVVGLKFSLAACLLILTLFLSVYFLQEPIEKACSEGFNDDYNVIEIFEKHTVIKVCVCDGSTYNCRKKYIVKRSQYGK